MGYTTDFNGRFELDRIMKIEHAEYFRAFNRTRRMKRNAEIADTFPDQKRIAAGLPIGIDGEFFVGNEKDFGQENDASTINHNGPASTQPGLWCQWTVSDDNKNIEWDGGEKFYEYIEWLAYIIKSFLKPWSYVLNGKVEWYGEDRGDTGIIKVENNEIFVAVSSLIEGEYNHVTF